MFLSSPRKLPAFGILVLVSALAGVNACDGRKTPPRNFDAPMGIAIGPYGDEADPHAFVADAATFAVRRIDLRRRRVIEPRLPVGRPLGPVAVHVGPAGVVDRVWGVDLQQNALVALDPVVALAPTVGPVSFDDEGPDSTVEIGEVRVTSGRTATQSWTVTYREALDRWVVRASGSGVQRTYAKTGSGYRSDEGEVRFTIRRTGDAPPTEGDTFRFETDNGVELAAFATTGSAVNVIAVSNDVGVLTSGDPARATAFDLGTGLEIQAFDLPAGSAPGGMEVAPDGSAVYISDLGNPFVHRLVTSGVPSSWILESLPAMAATRDVAISGDGMRAFAMAADATDVFVFTLPGWVPVDFLGATPGIDPVPFPGALRAIAGSRLPHVMQGSGVPGYPIYATTHEGLLFAMNGATGCLDFADSRGARLTGVRFRDAAAASAPKFDVDAFQANRCGGIVKSETWVLVYNGLLQAWEVEGNVSGKQVGVMQEDVLYVTDRGELTMRIESDPEFPTDDSDTFFVSVTDGLLGLGVGLIPDRPVFFTMTQDGEPVEYALVPNSASETVSQIDVGRRRVIATYR